MYNTIRVNVIILDYPFLFDSGHHAHISTLQSFREEEFCRFMECSLLLESLTRTPSRTL